MSYKRVYKMLFMGRDFVYGVDWMKTRKTFRNLKT